MVVQSSEQRWNYFCPVECGQLENGTNQDVKYNVDIINLVGVVNNMANLEGKNGKDKRCTIRTKTKRIVRSSEYFRIRKREQRARQKEEQLDKARGIIQPRGNDRRSQPSLCSTTRQKVLLKREYNRLKKREQRQGQKEKQRNEARVVQPQEDCRRSQPLRHASSMGIVAKKDWKTCFGDLLSRMVEPDRSKREPKKDWLQRRNTELTRRIRESTHWLVGEQVDARDAEKGPPSKWAMFVCCDPNPDHNKIKELASSDLPKERRPWVHVQKSTIRNAGDGLFASTDFYEEQVIGIYLGYVRERDHSTNSHCLGIGMTKYVRDARGYPSNDKTDLLLMGLHFINDPRLKDYNIRANGRRAKKPHHSDKRYYNVYFTKDMLAVALRPIRLGEELFACYSWVQTTGLE